MKDKFEKAFSSIVTSFKETIDELSTSAKEKTGELIDDWLSVFPELEAMGLEITSFGISLAISPALEVEMRGSGAAFTDERIGQLLEDKKGSSQLTLVLKTIKTTRKMYKKLGKDVYSELYLKVKVRIPPEVCVYYGQPVIL